MYGTREASSRLSREGRPAFELSRSDRESLHPAQLNRPLIIACYTPQMLGMLRDLVHHKNYANAALLNAIAEHEKAAEDPEILHLLHHIIVANRFWVALFLGHLFDIENESKSPESLKAVVALYRETHEREVHWLNGLRDPDLDRVAGTLYIPNQSFSLAQAMMQVCLHSHGHRAQCAAKLRALGGNPPPTDFIAWLKDRPAPNWSRAA